MATENRTSNWLMACHDFAASEGLVWTICLNEDGPTDWECHFQASSGVSFWDTEPAHDKEKGGLWEDWRHHIVDRLRRKYGKALGERQTRLVGDKALARRAA